MKKILFTVWTTSLGGGAEKILSSLTKELEKEYSIDVLEVGKFGNYKIELGKNTKLLNPMVNKIDDSRIKYLIKRGLLEYFPNLVKKIKCKKKYDYEVAFNYLYPAYLIDKNVKSIAYNHGSIENLLEEKENKNRLKYKKALEHFNRIVAISNKTESSIVEVYPEYKNKIIKIYNGYNFSDIINKSMENVDISFDEDSLVFLGRLEEAKGVKRLLNIYLELNKKGVDKKLYLLGEGELREWIENFILENNLTNRVYLLGYQGNPYPFIKKASFIIMTSFAEGFPTVFAEGLALGVGFISTNVGGAFELSNDGLCGFVDDDNNNIVEYTYRELSKNKKDRLIKKENCIEHIKQYSIENQVNDFKKLLKEIDNE